MQLKDKIENDVEISYVEIDGFEYKLQKKLNAKKGMKLLSSIVGDFSTQENYPKINKLINDLINTMGNEMLLRVTFINNYEIIFPIMATLFGVPQSQLEKMDVRDYYDLVMLTFNFYKDFFFESRES